MLNHADFRSTQPSVTDTAADHDTKLDEVQAAATLLSPPESPKTAVEKDMSSIENLSLETPTVKPWMPNYIATLPPLELDVLAKIPTSQEMTTFHHEFIEQTLLGMLYSPGLYFNKMPGPCILPQRTYYMLGTANEPFLPIAPGEHGARLAPFIKISLEDEYEQLLQGLFPYFDVPMFVLDEKNRYIYYGNYSQTRWSDKLDHDTMTARVPQHVKEHWATELTALPRDEWVTEELKKHFFPMPEYQGRIAPAADDDDSSVHSSDELLVTDNMKKDITKYIKNLREWNRDAKVKTSLLSKDFILDRFDAVSALLKNTTDTC